MMKERPKTPFIEAAIASIGSIASLILHTALFAAAFLLSILGLIEWQFMLLVLTTIVSLEAIYMAIFIQIAVNRNTESLREVEEDIDEIQEDVEELGEDVEDIQEDIEEISEDIEEMSDEEKAEADDARMVKDEREKKEKRERREKKVKDEKELLEELTRDVQRLLKDLEALKKGQ
jgi:uncharacterized protein YoxC